MSDLDLTLMRPVLDLPPVPGLGVDVVSPSPRGMVTLRGDLSDAAFAAALKETTGCDVPEIRRSTTAGDITVLWMSLDELMVFCPVRKAASLVELFMAQADSAAVLALDVSDARAVFRVAGDRAWRVLAKGAPVDLAPGHFAVGEVRRTRIATVAVGIVKTDDDVFEVFCFRSYAAYMWNWLTVGAGADSLSDL